MTKLDEIIKKYEPCINSDEFAKAVALEFAKHILEEAADNAKTIRKEDYDKRSGEYFYYDVLKKKSITDTLNKYL